MISILIMAIALYKHYIYNAAPKAVVELYKVETYQPDRSGWGYRIYCKGKPFIQQEYIPAISGQHRFKNQQDAERTAELVKKKLLNGESPTLSRTELHQLGIE